MGSEFLQQDVYKRRHDIVASLDVFFSECRWLYLCHSDNPILSLNGKIKDDVREWCAENFESDFGFSKMSVQAVTTEHLHLHVTSERDLVLFKLFWF